MTPIAILATVDDHVQTYTVVGDSIVFGEPDASGTGQNGDTWHNLGMCKKAGRYGNPTVNLGVFRDITKDWATNYVMRDAILRKCNSEVILMACGINDISAGQTESQLKTVVKTFLDQYTGVKKIYSTITPRASSTDTLATVVNQYPVANTAGNASRRGFINTELRAGKCLEYGADYYWDRCIPSEYDYANSSGKWDFGPSAETPYAYTKDGLRPTSVGQDRIAYSSPPLPTQYFTIGVGGMYADQNAFLSASIPAIEGNVEVLDRSLPVNLLGAYTVKYTFAPVVQPWAVPTNYQYSYKWSY
jgi:lysophospholipase L1-like esterase